MQKIVISISYGGFGISRRAAEFIAERKGRESGEPDRDDLDLIAAVESLGKEADGAYAKLKIVEIPDGVDWVIEEYDGSEWVAEKHRTWR